MLYLTKALSQIGQIAQIGLVKKCRPSSYVKGIYRGKVIRNGEKASKIKFKLYI